MSAPEFAPNRPVRELLDEPRYVEAALRAGVIGEGEKQKITAIPLWRMAHDAGDSIATAADRLGVEPLSSDTTQWT